MIAGTSLEWQSAAGQQIAMTFGSSLTSPCTPPLLVSATTRISYPSQSVEYPAWKTVVQEEGILQSTPCHESKQGIESVFVDVECANAEDVDTEACDDWCKSSAPDSQREQDSMRTTAARSSECFSGDSTRRPSVLYMLVKPLSLAYDYLCQWTQNCHTGRHRLPSSGCQSSAVAEAPTSESVEEHSDNANFRDSYEHSSEDIPDYVLEYAPLVHLFSGERYWPCDIAEHLQHVTPRLNFTPMQSESDHPKLEDLDKFNKYEKGRWVYLTSNDNVEEYPDWLGGQKNIPSTPGSDEDDEEQHLIGKGIAGGRSDAPAVLVVVDKGHGIVDAFWFFFYSYNLGNAVFNIRFGNHVGDWEHSAVRFHYGKPKSVFFSEHNFGSAYSYGAVEKLGKRPVIYSAVGTHAMYATPGRHPYVLPWGILHDETDRGPLWDPALNSHTYTYNHETETLRPSNITPKAPTEWFHFAGHWGDRIYPIDDKRQYRAFGQYHYVSGPLGPKFKNLGRKKICGGPDSQPCVIKHWLGSEKRAPRFESYGEEADAFSAWVESQRDSGEM